MRVIKFRAWREQVSRFRFFDISTGFNVENADVFKSVEQFIGLKDCNGVDIYEGDIVKVLFTDWPSQSRPEKLSLEDYMDSLANDYPVVFHDGAFQMSSPCRYGDGLAHEDIYCGKHGFIRVIGNIHENSELIEDKQHE